MLFKPCCFNHALHDCRWQLTRSARSTGVVKRNADLHDNGSEGFHLLHVACSELGALVWVEHDQIDLALDILHQLHQPACAQSLCYAACSCLFMEVQHLLAHTCVVCRGSCICYVYTSSTMQLVLVPPGICILIGSGS